MTYLEELEKQAYMMEQIEGFVPVDPVVVKRLVSVVRAAETLLTTGCETSALMLNDTLTLLYGGTND